MTAPPADTATSGSVVSVALAEWKLVPSQATVRPGRVTFVVRNDGSIVHELVVLRSQGPGRQGGRDGSPGQDPAGPERRLEAADPEAAGREVRLALQSPGALPGGSIRRASGSLRRA